MSLNLDKSKWKRVRLGEVIRRSRVQVDPVASGVERYVAGGHVDSEGIAIERWGHVGDGQMGSTFRYVFGPGQVLFVSARPYLRKVGVPDFSGVVADKTYVLDAVPENGLLQDFLPFVLSSEAFISYATAEATGSMNPRLLWGPMQRYDFDLPSLDEQKRLADLLWAVERHRLALHERLMRESELVRVYLRSWWRSGKRQAIGEFAICVTGSTPSRSNEAYWNSLDIPFYTPSEIKGDTMNSARQRVSLQGSRAGRMLPVNAVAIACIGGELGKSAVIVEPGISNQQITAVVGLSKDDAYLLQALLAHPEGRAAMEARETTTIVRKLNKSDLMRVEVPWPDRREGLHTVIWLHRRVASAVGCDLAKLSVLRSALLSEVFGGAE